MADIYGDIIREQNEHKKRIKRLEEVESPRGVYVPLATPRLPTAFDGDLYDADNDGAIDLQAAAPAGFGLPAGVKAVVLSFAIKQLSTNGKQLQVGPNSSYPYAMTMFTKTNNVYENRGPVTIPCDGGDIWFQTDAVDGAELYVYMRCWGYYI